MAGFDLPLSDGKMVVVKIFGKGNVGDLSVHKYNFYLDTHLTHKCRVSRQNI